MFRASVFAVVAVQLAALGHALGGGGLPDPAVLLTVAAFLGGAVSSLATRRLSGAQICALLLTSQLVFHSVFEVTATHAEHASTGSAVGTGQMLLFHLVAALATDPDDGVRLEVAQPVAARAGSWPSPMPAGADLR